MIHTEFGLTFSESKTKKPKRYINRCTDSTVVFRHPNGGFLIYGISPYDNKDNVGELQFIRLSEEVYKTEKEATQHMLQGTYTLNPDYKSYFIHNFEEFHPLSHAGVLKLSESFCIGIAEVTYDDHVGRQEVVQYFQLSTEEFETQESALEALNSGDWTCLFKFNVLPFYIPQNKLRVMLDKNGKFILARNRMYENERTGEPLTDYHEYICIRATTHEEAEQVLNEYLEGL